MTNFDPVEYKKIERHVYGVTAPSYEKFGAAAFERFARPLLDAAELKPGLRVLDVACGPGIPSLDAAASVAPGGSVTGVDLAPGMLDLARQKAAERGLDNVTFQEADGEALPFADGSFDVVLCNHGLVHMTDRAKGLAEMYRVLKEGHGRLALSVWSTSDRTVTIGIVARAIHELWPAAVVPEAPMWFDFGPEGALEKALAGAGIRSVETGRHNFPLEVRSAREYWEGIIGISGRLQMLLKSVPPDVATKIETTILAAAEGFRTGVGLRIPCEEIVAVAEK